MCMVMEKKMNKPKVLFVTYLPDYNCNAGDKIYSINIINELKKICELEVLSFIKDDEYLGAVKNPIASVFSIHPAAIYIHKSSIAESVFLEKNKQQYDVIIFDHFRMVWLVDYIDKNDFVKKIYISHNIESLSRANGFKLESNWIKKVALWWDYIKTKYWEDKYIKKFDFCTVISDVDKEFLVSRGVNDALLLKPGYSGAVYLNKKFESCKNVVAWVGSFKYFAKKINLIHFCEAVKNYFGNDNVPFILMIVGLMDKDFEDEISSKYKFCQIKSNVDSVYPYLEKAKCGIVFEPVGGGFKLKVLDYVFTKTPIIALHGSCEGIDFKNHKHFIEVMDAVAMIETIENILGDVDLAYSLSNNAYEFCNQHYHWSQQVECFKPIFNQ